MGLEIEDKFKVLEATESLQKEMHDFIEEAYKVDKFKEVPYDTFKDIFFMLKISELQKQIEILSSK